MGCPIPLIWKLALPLLLQYAILIAFLSYLTILFSQIFRSGSKGTLEYNLFLCMHEV